MALSKIDVSNMLDETLPVANGGTGVTTAANLANTSNLVLLNTVTTTDATTTNIDFDSTYINSTYDTYKIFSQVHPVTDNVQLRVRMSLSGTFQTGASYYGQGLINDGATSVNNNATDNWDVALGVGNASGEGASTDFTLIATNDTNIPTMMIGTISMRSYSGNHGMQAGSYCVNSADAHDGIRFYWSNGNFDTGSKISLYGVKS